MESMFGFGMMAGPLIGGVLYKYGGFCLPFVVIGGIMVMCSVIALIMLKTNVKNEPAHCEAAKVSRTKFSTLLKIPQGGNSVALSFALKLFFQILAYKLP